MNNRILYFATEDWFFCSHWLSLAKAASRSGYRVTVVTRVRDHGDQIREAGFELEPLELERGASGIIGELKTLWRVFSIYRKVQPAVTHHLGQKPMVYGTIAAAISGVPSVINSVMGLGHLFICQSLKARAGRALVSVLYSILLNLNRSTVIVENPDDLKLLREKKIIRTDKVQLIRGAGVDCSHFSYTEERDTVPIVIMASRLLRDKGVEEFVEAARIIKKRGTEARFALVGMSDPQNPTAIPGELLERWEEEEVVEIWGHRDDMAEVMASAHLVCLPSYREGLPKVLLEAAASGRAIVTTNVPGCREIVRDGENGLLVPPYESKPLATALEQLLASKVQRREMGQHGRMMVEKHFEKSHIISSTLKLYRSAIGIRPQTRLEGSCSEYGKKSI